MAKLHELEKYLTHEFSTGCYTGEDYKSANTSIICARFAKKMVGNCSTPAKDTTNFQYSSATVQASTFTFLYPTSAFGKTNGITVS